MTPLSDDRILEISKSIMGWLDPRESLLLYHQALAIPDNGGGVVVEVGSYRGRSTVILALGAKERHGRVYAVDHFDGNGKDLVVTQDDLAALRLNLETYEVTDIVDVIERTSLDAAHYYQWKIEGLVQIDLLFLDGSHQYEDVKADLAAWSPFVTGKIAMHDTLENGNWPGVVQALNEFVAAGEWAVVQRADATAVLERVAVAQQQTKLSE